MIYYEDPEVRAMPRNEARVHEIDFEALGMVGEYLMACLDDGQRPLTVWAKLERLTDMQRRMRIIDVTGATVDDAARWWRSLRGSRLANSTRANHLSAARAFYRWLIAQDIIEADPTRRLHSPPVRKGIPRGIDPAPVLALLERLDGARHHMIALALWCGLRCAEIARVRRRDLAQAVDGTWTLLVHAKGGQTRVVTVPGPVVDRMLPGWTGWLLPSPRSLTGHVGAYRVSTAGAETLRDAGIDSTMHQLRHTHATELYRRTRDLVAVQKQLGHASVATTQVYAASAGLSADVIGTLYDRPTRSEQERARRRRAVAQQLMAG